MTLSVQQWLEVKLSTREALAKIFRLKKSTFTHVSDQKVLSDGYTYEDLKAISLEEMKALTHLDSDIYEEQFRLVVKMIEDQTNNVSSIGTENDKTNGPEPRETPATAGEDQSATREGSGSKQTEENNQGKDLSVSGGIEQVDNGSDELLPSGNNLDQSGMAEQDEEIDVKKSGSGKNDRRQKRGLQEV